MKNYRVKVFALVAFAVLAMTGCGNGSEGNKSTPTEIVTEVPIVTSTPTVIVEEVSYMEK